jgi:hypothetical protein
MSNLQTAKEKANVVMNWDMSDVRLRMKKEDATITDTFLNKLEVEYKRFMTLRLFHPQETMPVSPIVDEMWHTHILFTSDYVKMAQSVGEVYFHHRPIVSQKDVVELTPLYEKNTLKRYAEIYGKPTPEFWTEDCVCGSCATA